MAGCVAVGLRYSVFRAVAQGGTAPATTTNRQKRTLVSAASYQTCRGQLARHPPRRIRPRIPRQSLANSLCPLRRPSGLSHPADGHFGFLDLTPPTQPLAQGPRGHGRTPHSPPPFASLPLPLPLPLVLQLLPLQLLPLPQFVTPFAAVISPAEKSTTAPTTTTASSTPPPAPPPLLAPPGARSHTSTASMNPEGPCFFARLPSTIISSLPAPDRVILRFPALTTWIGFFTPSPSASFPRKTPDTTCGLRLHSSLWSGSCYCPQTTSPRLH